MQQSKTIYKLNYGQTTVKVGTFFLIKMSINIWVTYKLCVVPCNEIFIFIFDYILYILQIYIRNLNVRIVLTRVVTFTSADPYTAPSESSYLLSNFTEYSRRPSGVLNIPRDNILLVTYVEYHPVTCDVVYFQFNASFYQEESYSLKKKN